MKILLICGSPRQASKSRKIIQYVASLMKEQMKCEISIFDVGLQRLPLMDGTEETCNDPLVQKLQTQVGSADGLFICTPEYHNGMSGALKNALDHLGSEHFRGKPVSIAASAGGGKGGMNALNNLRIVLRGVGALVLTEQIVVDPRDVLEGDLFTPDIQKRLQFMVDELRMYTQWKEKIRK